MRRISKKRAALRKAVEELTGHMVFDDPEHDEVGMPEIDQAVQVCSQCGGKGTGLGIEHKEDCLVPLLNEANHQTRHGGK